MNPEHATSLDSLIREAIQANPEISAFGMEVAGADARTRIAGTLDDPELMFMREEMPGFRWQEAMRQRVGLYQMLRFPSKLSADGELAGIQAEKSRHTRDEKVNEIVARVRGAYAELWYVQGAMLQTEESEQILRQVAGIVETKVSVGLANLQDALKISVELARSENRKTVLREQELSAKAMLAALLDRPAADTLGYAVLPPVPAPVTPVDSLEYLAHSLRPMVRRDSLMIVEGEVMKSLSRREYIPDLRLGVEYVTQPAGDFRGWNLFAGVTLPFAPWSLGKAAGRTEEAEALKRRGEEEYRATNAMVRASVRELYYKATSARNQVRTFEDRILPDARRSLEASIIAYRTGGSDILMVLDAWRMSIDVTMESLMARMTCEQTMAELDRAVGLPAPLLAGM